ncbi:hypothetical protein LDENG_00118870 [Lucifuga dentata]|nr:hypothetical protein LDENG_00118870 [Lucifuga dentata]
MSSARHIGPSTLLTLRSRIPEVLASLSDQAGSVVLTYEVNRALCDLLDTVAPITTKLRHPRKQAPWFTEQTRALKQVCRRLEHKWRKYKLEVCFMAWQDSIMKYKQALSNAKTTYLSHIINENKHNQVFICNSCKTDVKAACCFWILIYCS